MHSNISFVNYSKSPTYCVPLKISKIRRIILLIIDYPTDYLQHFGRLSVEMCTPVVGVVPNVTPHNYRLIGTNAA